MTDSEIIEYCFHIEEDYGISQKWEDILKDLTPFPSGLYPDYIYWKKNGLIYFEQDKTSKTLWCNYDLVWKIFRNKEKYDYDETESLIKNLLNTTEMWKDYDPWYLSFIN